jgi:hypothetical protein
LCTFNVMYFPTFLFICYYHGLPRKQNTDISGKRLPVPDFFFYLSFSCQIKHELEMCELRRYFENYCREIEAKYRHELEDTVLSSSRITRTLPAITRSFILFHCPVLRSRKYFFGLRLRGAVNPNNRSGSSSSYMNIFAAFGFLFLIELVL